MKHESIEPSKRSERGNEAGTEAQVHVTVSLRDDRSLKVEYQHAYRIAEEKRALRDAAKKAYESAEEALRIAESKAHLHASELLRALRFDVEETDVAPESRRAYEAPPSSGSFRAGSLKRGESIRLDSGRSIVFDGGVEVRFPVPTLLPSAELEKLARAARDAMEAREPPADASVKIRPHWLGKTSSRA